MNDTSSISFHFDDTAFRLRQRQAIRAWLFDISVHHGASIAHLNYMFCSDERMLAMNGQHLDHHYYTDILTFPMPSGQGLSGDLLISIDRVRDNAKAHGTRAQDELHRVMAHGLLHLIGLDDITPSAQQAMRAAEDHALSTRTFL